MLLLLQLPSLVAADPLYQVYRPPRQTVAQAQLMAQINASAVGKSAAAEQWVRSYVSSPAVRAKLHSSLQVLSADELFERFVWQMNRLPIFHNAPASELNFHETCNGGVICDDSPVNATVRSGYLQNTCIRETIGGPQYQGFSGGTIKSEYGYATAFADMGLPTSVLVDPQWPLRQANECFLFNANELKLRSIGNFVYGGVTWVLNPATLKGRSLVESWDWGNIKVFVDSSATGVPFPGFGTLDHWYHLVEFHEALFNQPYPAFWGIQHPCCTYSLADLLNRWLVADTFPAPSSGMLLTNPYYEIMTVGNVWLPEDILYAAVIASDQPASEGGGIGAGTDGVQHVGLFGTPDGEAMRDAFKASRRPLIWTDNTAHELSTPSPTMLIDPHVGAIAGGRITADDVAWWDARWAQAVAAWPSEHPTHGPTDWASQRARFAAVIDEAPPHLRLQYRNYDRKHICEALEATAGAMVLGIDGSGNCVYWQADNSSPATATPVQWELLNDGTCEQSQSVRPEAHLFSSSAECEAAAASVQWRCVRLAPPEAQGGGDAAYCVPDDSPAGAAAASPSPSSFSNLAGCEAECTRSSSAASPPPADGRGNCCWPSVLSCEFASPLTCPVSIDSVDISPCHMSEDTCTGYCSVTTAAIWCPVDADPPAASPPADTWIWGAIGGGVALVGVYGGAVLLLRARRRKASGRSSAAGGAGLLMESQRPQIGPSTEVAMPERPEAAFEELNDAALAARGAEAAA